MLTPCNAGFSLQGTLHLDGLTQQLNEIAEIGRRQLFFVGGPPRSGTTWLQQILNAHPDICCHGEGFLAHQLAQPLAAVIEAWRQVIVDKNAKQFEHIFRRLFPNARFIAVLRNPRDVVTSSWHYFHPPVAAAEATAAKLAFIQRLLPQFNLSVRALVAHTASDPMRTMTVTYDRLTDETAITAAELFEFLGVSADPDIVASAIAQASFETAANGRKRGDPRNGAFLRKGVNGDWRSALTPAMSALILRETGWMFPLYGWQE